MNHRVLVYGSLKRDFRNNWFLRHSDYLGEAVTANAEFNMVSLGVFPAVTRGTHRLRGEVYLVDSDTLKTLDALESNGSLYQRHLIPLEGHEAPAWMYVFMWDTSSFPSGMMGVEETEGENIQEWVGAPLVEESSNEVVID